eukprot:CAMPEP_0168172936 /NCGR_PEP_ID=MMETSP0139_2-20121125/5570_1 /TAXON_ID=44445 /ORGANISM="Pseudo-nitzschia australis, Strain 10249 10 AB" /LENGTH=144 /DNA_ID=CAMNT_0008090721 /DNA_START=542 /DNA_END=976 /DNA_ORIENTATION=-
MTIARKEIPDQRRDDHFGTAGTPGGNGKRLGTSSSTMLTRLLSRALSTRPSLQVQPEHKRKPTMAMTITLPPSTTTGTPSAPALFRIHSFPALACNYIPGITLVLSKLLISLASDHGFRPAVSNKQHNNQHVGRDAGDVSNSNM